MSVRIGISNVLAPMRLVLPSSISEYSLWATVGPRTALHDLPQLQSDLSRPGATCFRREVTAKPIPVDDVTRAAQERSALPARSGLGFQARRTRGQQSAGVGRTRSPRT